MEINDIARQIAIGLINTGVEGEFGSVSCSTNGDYPSIGCSQWEDGRADNLLSYVSGGSRFIGRSYSEIEDNDELDELAELLESDEGVAAQLTILSDDCKKYVEAVMEAGVTDPRCIIYAGMWCPTSHYMVQLFLENRADRININNLSELFDIFRDEYAYAVECDEYAEGYANRAINTYEYMLGLDLSMFGVSRYIE